jgi:single-stranded-DNA-specific exonuclease
MSKTLKGSNVIFLNNHEKNYLFQDFMHDELNNDLNKYLPYSLPNENDGLNLMKDFIDNKRKIGIVGDFDVDGSCATSMLIRYLKLQEANFCYYTPNRMRDGYGISPKIVHLLKDQGVELVVTLDNGTTAFEAIDAINEANMKSIVIDHHTIGSQLPKTVLINPHLNANNGVFRDLCATGVLFIFLCKLNNMMSIKVKMKSFLDLVAIATVCDVMPMRNINKALVSMGLKEMNLNLRFCFKIILLNNLSNITTETIGFYLGPFINAPGRMGNSDSSIQLMTTDDEKQVIELCQQVIEYNRIRKSIEKEIMVSINNLKHDKKSIFLANKWHEGVIGIVSGKLKETHGKPTCIMSVISDDVIKGSMRAPETFHVGNFIKDAIVKGLVKYGGGHNCAGGFTTSHDKLSELSDFLESSVLVEYEPSIRVFSLLSLHAINDEFMKSLSDFGPYGPSHEHPLFMFPNCRISDIYLFNNHMSVFISNMFIKFKSFVFNVDTNPLYAIKNLEYANVIGYPYMSGKQICMRVVDVIKI